MSEDMAKETPVEELQGEAQNGPIANRITTDPQDAIDSGAPPLHLEDIAYFVVFPQSTKLLDEAIAVIPNEVARKAVIEAINSVLVPISNEQVEEAKNRQGQDAPSE